MWETDFFATVMNRIEDAIRGIPRTTGAGGGLERWWNQRIERLLAKPGTMLWGEMKQNADCISQYREGVHDDAQAGAVLLYRHFKHKVDNKQVRMHLVGHSAGSIVASFMIDRLVREEGLKLESVSFMAPAVRVETFDRLVRPHLDSGAVKRFQQLYLSDRAEEDDAHLRTVPALAALSRQRIVRRRRDDADPRHAEVFRSVCQGAAQRCGGARRPGADERELDARRLRRRCADAGGSGELHPRPVRRTAR